MSQIDAWTDQELVDELLDVEKGLSAWEIEFADSLATQLDIIGAPLTQRQRSKAVEILAGLHHDD